MDRLCLECGTRLKGREDQKFCIDQCRNTYNNRLNKDETSYMKNVGRILRKNRRVLKKLNPDGKSKISKFAMISMGFNFRFFTNVGMTSEGNVYFFCYDYGYLPLENDYFSLVKNKEI